VAVEAQAATPALPGSAPLLSELRELILSARQQVAQTVNSGLTMPYWRIGSRIRKRRSQREAPGVWTRDFAIADCKIGMDSFPAPYLPR